MQATTRTAEAGHALVGIARGRVGLDYLLAATLVDVAVADAALLAIGIDVEHVSAGAAVGDTLCPAVVGVEHVVTGPTDQPVLPRVTRKVVNRSEPSSIPRSNGMGRVSSPDLAEPHYGHEGMVRYLSKIGEVLDDYRMVPERFIDAGEDQVLVFSREGGRGKSSGAEVETHLTAHLWTVKDGKATRMQSYWERADALEAVGLSE